MIDNDRATLALAAFMKSVDETPICVNMADYDRVMYNAMVSALLCADSVRCLEEARPFIQSDQNILQ